ncbi:MAG TPA: hypothetical protein VGD26_00385 [Chitinophagaceae bacterium]
MAKPEFVAKIVFVSGETLDEDDHPLSVRMVFDPNITESGVAPPAFVIARDVFLSDIQGAISRYMELTGQTIEFEYLAPDMDEYEEEWEEETGEEEDDDSPAFGENLKPKTVN